MTLRKKPKTAAEYLADETGRPVEDFEPPEDIEYPHPEDLEWEKIDQ